MERTPLGLKVLAVIGALVVVPGGAFLAIANVGTGGKVAIAAGVAWWLIASAVLGKTLLQRKPDLRTPVRITLAVAAVASIVTAFMVTRGNTVDEDIVTAAPTARAADQAERDAALAGSEADGRAAAPKKQKKAKAKAEKPKAAQAKPKPEPKPKAKPEPAPAKPTPAKNVQLASGSFSGESGHRGKGKAAVVKLAKGGRVVTFSSFDVDPGAGDLRVYLHEGKTTSDDLGDFVEIAKLKGNKGDQQYGIPSKVDFKRYDTVVIWCVPFSTRIAQAPLG